VFIHDIKVAVEDILEMEIIEKIKQNNLKCFLKGFQENPWEII
jgi:hypothetical protein